MKKLIKLIKRIVSSIKLRWAAETPKIWKFVRNLAATIGTVSTAILAAETAAGIDISENYRHLLAWGIGIGAGVAAIAQMQKK